MNNVTNLDNRVNNGRYSPLTNSQKIDFVEKFDQYLNFHGIFIDLINMEVVMRKLYEEIIKDVAMEISLESKWRKKFSR